MEEEEYIREVVKEISKTVPDSYNKIELCKEYFKELSDSAYDPRAMHKEYLLLIPHDVSTEDRDFYIHAIMLLNGATLALRQLVKCKVGIVYNHGESMAAVIRLDPSKPLNGTILDMANAIQECIEDIRRLALSIYYSEETTSKNIYEHFLKYFIGSFPDYLTNNYTDYEPYFTDSTYSTITKLRPRL